MTPVASVVICTYNRPALFEAALRSCLRDATRRGMAFEIVVADNSINGHAAAILAPLPTSGIPVRVVRVTPPNISLARNAGLLAAAAPLVAFMDDDLEVDPGWLDGLVDTLTRCAADVVLGPVRPQFPDDSPPAWDPLGVRFSNLVALPTGSTIIAVGPEKTANYAVSTANSLWRAATCFTDAEPFDPSFGACGGEDFDLFLRLAGRGRSIVWCAEAGVRETVPPGRMRLGYQWLRAYSGAQVFAAATVKNTRSRNAALVSLGARGLAQVVLNGLPALILASVAWLGPASLTERAARLSFSAAAGWGKVMWWRRVRLYHVERPPAH